MGWSMVQVAATRPLPSLHLPHKCERKYTHSAVGEEKNESTVRRLLWSPSSPACLDPRARRELTRWSARWNGSNKFLCNGLAEPRPFGSNAQTPLSSSMLGRYCFPTGILGIPGNGCHWRSEYAYMRERRDCEGKDKKYRFE